MKVCEVVRLRCSSSLPNRSVSGSAQRIGYVDKQIITHRRHGLKCHFAASLSGALAFLRGSSSPRSRDPVACASDMPITRSRSTGIGRDRLHPGPVASGQTCHCPRRAFWPLDQPATISRCVTLSQKEKIRLLVSISARLLAVNPPDGRRPLRNEPGRQSRRRVRSVQLGRHLYLEVPSRDRSGVA